MARSGLPSMTALLGLLAVAGYQNRDKLGQMLGQGGQGSAGGMGGMGGGMAGLPGGLGGLLGGLMGGGQGGGMGSGMGMGSGRGGLGGLLGGGLNELNGRFEQRGHRETMDSWVGSGPNRNIEPHDLEAALGPEVIEDLTESTGLSRDEVLRRLSRELPEAVNQYTPNGRLPRDDDFA